MQLHANLMHFISPESDTYISRELGHLWPIHIGFDLKLILEVSIGTVNRQRIQLWSDMHEIKYCLQEIKDGIYDFHEIHSEIETHSVYNVISGKGKSLI